MYGKIKNVPNHQPDIISPLTNDTPSPSSPQHRRVTTSPAAALRGGAGFGAGFGAAEGAEAERDVARSYQPFTGLKKQWYSWLVVEVYLPL